MKEIKLYQCSVCNTQYKKRLACENCENSHRTDLEIVDQAHRPYADDHSGFPIRIIARDKKTGEATIYTRQGGADGQESYTGDS